MTQFSSLKRVPAPIELADEITNQILDGRLKPETMLPIEQDLADSFQVNRSTLREGLRVLEQRGLVERRGKLLYVKKPSTQLVANTVGHALMLHDVTFHDVYDVGMLLFPAAAELAALNIDDLGKESMRTLLEETDPKNASPSELSLLDIQFFRLISEGTGNVALQMSLAPLGLVFFSAFRTVLERVPVASERMLESHRRVCDAICQRDPLSARHWMTKHVEDFKRGCEASGISFDGKIGLDDQVISTFRK